VSRQWTTVPVPYSLADAQSFVTERASSAWGGGTWMFAVEADHRDGPRFCGTVELRDEGSRRAEIAYGAHPWARGRGLVHRALELLLAWGFDERGLETVIWWANRGNWASRRAAWRLGFSFDGTLERWLPQRGDLRDAWVGVLHADEPREPRHLWLEAPRITGDKVALRPFRPQDLSRVVEACRDERTAYWLRRMPSPYTRADGEAYLEGRIEQLATGAGVSWAVTDLATDELVGNVSLFDLRPGEEAEIGYWTHPSSRGRGVMTEACGLVVRHGFTSAVRGGLGLRRLAVRAAETNAASRHVIEANGFVQVGRQRRGSRLRNGSCVDTVCYDLLREEYT
jgi:RimJ/RimL family protein N-acetyltransferase